jgi:O-antigen/teichoic acid export membrane protein
VSTLRKSVAFSALDSYLGLVLQIASTVIIARLLTPEQTGVFAVAAVFAALASTFRDFGVAEYLIQEKELDNTAIRAALAINIMISWTMAALLFVLSWAAVDFYRNPGVGQVMRVQAVGFLLIPFGAVTMAWFRREMNFKPVFLTGLLANVCSFVVAIALALKGFGYMSMAWSSLAGTVVMVAASVAMRPKSFPLMPSLKGVAKVLHFGKFATGIYLFGQLGKGAPEMILGRALDMAAVGIFSRAGGLVEIFNRLVLRAIMPIYLPYFAQSMRDEGTPRRGLLLAMSYTTAVGWPFLLFMGLAAFGVIRLMYGVQWMAAVPLAQLLCAVAAVELIYSPAKEALLALGKPKSGNNLQMTVQGFRVLGLLAAVPWGLTGACWGLLLAAVLGAVASHLALARHLQLSLADVWRTLAPSATLAVASSLPLLLGLWWLPMVESNYLTYVLAGGALTALLWLLLAQPLGHPMAKEVHRLLGAARARLQRSQPR